MNLPNSLTLARLLLIPVFLVLVSLESLYTDAIAAAVFVLSAVTDGLDGYYARKNKQVTLLGKFMDPLVDKLLISAALVVLVELGRLPGWIAVVIISREFAVTGLRSIAAAEGVIITASKLGKIKTVTQVIAITALFLRDYPFSLIHLPFASIAMAVALLFTLWSGLDYFMKAWKFLKKDGY
ncbi:MAG TPA: CDP-diacylglycerol--glycerol-3-phosphate 3-phosphatidyltransferase [Bacillota bacterium]|nr:CDP-diacylglycerol--glycerol-3-phosphate 3-phosphatidyltransferase [Peptococcaceae bacterium MAG4]HPZ42442.1 CDP-diacylglycerol--glycerol-3-phosphate 3-phosphatidyltransferase [Bacillota bacterium]HQD75108.1 CDP-diacylglycerol--glycerol-3-phosphate 3-phosphatidyltransferase [Bacillota bacterium]HUM57665.1 CDP-diacylglycerol--glycerol-3-phosphate 3-phosphatidyltransferase [Bacillota bacterium]